MNAIPSGWRVIQPETNPPKRTKDPHRNRTMRRAWEKILKPRMEAEQAKRASFAPYVTALNAWEEYWFQRWKKRRSESADSGLLSVHRGDSVPQTEAPKTPTKKRIFDPPVHRITKDHLARFRAWLTVGGDRKPITINNYLRSVNAILTSTEDHEWIQGRQPKLRRLKAVKAAPKLAMDMEQVGSLYRACDRARWPKVDRRGNPIDTAAHWRAAVVLFSCFGFRTQELLRYQSWKRSLTWENFQWQSVSPGLSNATTEYGWLCYVPEKQEGFKPEPLVLAMPEIVRLHLRSLLPSGVPECQKSRPIFDWPLNRRYLNATWKAVCRAGGVTVQQSGTTRFELKHFRKTATTWHNLQSPGIAKWIVGHSERTSSVSDLHYNNPEIATTRALNAWQYPKAFDSIRDTGQKELF